MYQIALITGDGIGPEISESVIKVLETINDKLDCAILRRHAIHGILIRDAK